MIAFDAIAMKPAARCACGGAICGVRDDGEPRIRSYRCRGCRRRVPWCFGADDDAPDYCDDCWAAANAEGAA